MYTNHPPKRWRQRFSFQCRYDLIPFTGITKCFLHSRKWCTVAVTLHVFFFFIVWCWCESLNIHLIGWNISLRDPWDLSIFSFVRELLMLQFEGKQKWNLVRKHTLVIDMQQICPWQLIFLIIFLTTNCLNHLNCMICFYSLSRLFEPLVPWTFREQNVSSLSFKVCFKAASLSCKWVLKN